MCDTHSIFSLPVFCFLMPGGKVACLKLAEYFFFFFVFYVKNRKDVFLSGWKCGAHMNGFPVSEQLEEHRVHPSLHVMWWPAGQQCSQAGAHSWLCWRHRINHGFSGKRVWYPACCWCSPLHKVLMRDLWSRELLKYLWQFGSFSSLPVIHGA